MYIYVIIYTCNFTSLRSCQITIKCDCNKKKKTLFLEIYYFCFFTFSSTLGSGSLLNYFSNPKDEKC